MWVAGLDPQFELSKVRCRKHKKTAHGKRGGKPMCCIETVTSFSDKTWSVIESGQAENIWNTVPKL